jgi:hypothetical protein
MPDPQRLLNTLRQAVQACKNTPGRQGRHIDLTHVEDCLVVGDLHGHLMNFKKLYEFAQLGTFPRRHLVVQEVIHSGQALGGSGGDMSHRLLDVVAALKCMYPTRVHYLMGNHELSQWTGRAITKSGVDLNEFFRQGVRTSYGVDADAILAAYNDFFATLPVSIRLPNRVFLSHSLPGLKRLPDWNLADIQREDTEYREEDYLLGGCVHAVVWGRDISEEAVAGYLAKVDADLLISGHIPCTEGYMTPNSRQLILDAKDDEACAVWVSTHRAYTLADLVAALVKVKKLG